MRKIKASRIPKTCESCQDRYIYSGRYCDACRSLMIAAKAEKRINADLRPEIAVGHRMGSFDNPNDHRIDQ